MPDAYLIFRKPLPFSAQLNGENWDIYMQRGMKSGTVALLAVRQSRGGKCYTLTSGRERDVVQDLRCGIRVGTGTPERGLVTALRRAGLVEVMAERLPPRY